MEPTLRALIKGECRVIHIGSTIGIARIDRHLKTLQPLILTARIADDDLEPFDRLRRQHFPADRNFLRAHLTMFHRLPGEQMPEILRILEDVSRRHQAMTAEVSGLNHLGAGVAYSISSEQLLNVHAELRSSFRPWLGGQDMQKWKPHITVQNKVSRSQADALFDSLHASFEPHVIEITGLDLWAYLGGPWRAEATFALGAGSIVSAS